MNKAYKRNHCIPRFLLNYWIDPTTPYRGVHVYQIDEGRSYVSTSIGKNAFSFAISPDLYVLEDGQKRALGVEQWLNSQEGALVRFVTQVHDHMEQVQFKSNDEAPHVLMAITSLQYRSQYNIQMLQDALAQNESFRSFVSANPERPIHQLVLENLIHLVTEMMALFSPPEMILLHAPASLSWITCDRPYFNYDGMDHRFVILTNKVALAYRKSASTYKYRYQDATKQFVRELNQKVAMQARKWIVATDAETLKDYAPIAFTKEWRRYKDSERAGLLPIRFLTSGWSIRARQ